MGVGQRDRTGERAVAGNGSVLAHQRAPEEGHELLAPRRRRVGRESSICRLLLEHLLLTERRLEHLAIQTAKDLFGSSSVEGDQDDALAVGLSGPLGRNGPDSSDGRDDCDARYERSMLAHARVIS